MKAGRRQFFTGWPTAKVRTLYLPRFNVPSLASFEEMAAGRVYYSSSESYFNTMDKSRGRAIHSFEETDELQMKGSESIR